MVFKITPVDPDKMTWTVTVDGKEIRPQHLEISSPYGNFQLGWRPEGYHGWAFKPGMKGAMTLPWTKNTEGEVLIGLVHEHRPNMGPGKVWCPLSGFVEVGESAAEGALRESLEEGGLDTSGATLLPGAQVNTDRMYYIMEPGDNWGMQMFACRIGFDLLEFVDENRWRPKLSVISHKKESDLFFLPWRKATVLSAGALALAGIARLMSQVL